MPNEKGFIIEEIMEKNVNRTNHLLGIGINDYEYCPKLNNAVKDVQDFVELMKNRFDFKNENISTLFDKAATGSNIIKALDKLSETLTEKDNLIIFFSGHGALHSRQEKGFWIPVEAKPDNYFGYLANTVIKDYLSAINAYHIFLIADSCFSGALFTTGSRDIGKRLEKNPSRWGLTSGQKEIVLDGKPGENSPFAKSLLYHLSNTARPIGVQELCSNVLETTAANARQTPLGEPLQVKGHKNGQFVFRLKKDEIRDWAKAEIIGTIVAFQQFLAVYPNGQFAEAAKNEIKNVKVETAWQRIKNSTNSVDFARYKKDFPNSKYVAEAQQRLLITEEDEEWKSVKRANKITRYERYLEFYPNGRYVTKAKVAINAIYDADKPKLIYQATPVIEPSKSKKETVKPPIKKEPKPITPTFDWQQLPWKKIGIGALILIGIIALAQSGLFSPKKELVFEEKDNLFGLKLGDEWLIEPKYYAKRDFQEELAAVNFENKWGYINEKGKLVIKYQYTTANSFVDGLASVCDGDSFCGFIDKSGEIIIPFIYESIANFSPNEDMVWVQKNGQAFYINKKGECVKDCPEESAEEKTEKEEKTEQEETQTAVVKKPVVRPIESARTSDPFAGQMKSIKGGTFQMGSNESDEEKPIHSVTVSSFYMSKYEVTQKQWRDIMGTNPSEFSGCDNCPVEQVSWDDIQEFIKKLNIKTGKNYRLPTEAEWEYAARGGQNYKYAGSDNLGSVAWYGDNSGSKTHPVGQKSANGYGLYDMSGNVWEWCSDWYGAGYYKNSPSNNPKGSNSGDSRVLRGGSWLNFNLNCRVANRFSSDPDNRYGNIGFRVVRGD